jgi:condensin complex subunit 2
MCSLPGQYLADLSVLENKAISHSLAGFSFSKDAFAIEESTLFRDDTYYHSDGADDDGAGMDNGGDNDFGMDIDGGGAPVEDFFVGDQAVGDDFGGDGMGQDDFSPDRDSGSVGADGEQQMEQQGRVGQSDPRRGPNERDLIMAMTDADGEGGMMDYFDQNFLKNWAGPEHWKLRKVVRRREFPSPSLKVHVTQVFFSGCRNQCI